MFTGIVAAVGRIAKVTPLGGADAGVRLTVDVRAAAGGEATGGEAAGAETTGAETTGAETPAFDLADVAIGDSIAIQGACMTVITKTAHSFDVEVSRESLNKTAGLDGSGEVNLEKALRPMDRLGGHMVSGHVDGLGEVMQFAPVGESWELVIRAPKELAKYLAYKGSITVNGVSLTVNRVSDVAEGQAGSRSAAGADISINLIPHTIAMTTLKQLKAGLRVNLEIDLIARYVERMLNAK